MPVGAIVDPSTRPLSEVARHLVIPTGIVDSVWFDLEDRFDEWGVSFDAWQDGLGQILLGLRGDGKYATTVGGSTMSIPRQVAKTFIVSRTIFALAAEFDGLTALWTAHRIRTATQTFQKLAAFAQNKRVKPYLAPTRNDGIRAANGEQEIRFRNGSVIMFGAREQGFGRGFDEVDVEVFDEAQILTEKALEDMVPAANQSRNPHGALLVYMGTPPRPTDPGEVFKSRRRKALAMKPADVVSVESGDAFYVECSADPDVGRKGGPSIDDMEQVRRANPSFPHRTPPESIARMRENLSSDEAWRREALGVWDEDQAGSRAIAASLWDDMLVTAAPVDGTRSYGVAFSQDGSRVAVAGALRGDGDVVHVELIDAADGDSETGLSRLADWFVAAGHDGAPRWKHAGRIVLAGSAGAGVLRQLLRDRKVSPARVLVAGTPQYLQACEMFRNATEERLVTHLAAGQTVLDESVAISDRDKRGGWVATVPDGDETPVEAVSLALWAAKTSKRKARSDGAGRALVL